MAFKNHLFNTALFLAAAVFVVDLVTAPGIAVWFLYVIPLLVVSGTKDRVHLLVVCFLCSLLTVLVVYIQPIADRVVENVANRGIGVALTFVMTFILIVRSRMSAQLDQRNGDLRDAYLKLKAEVAERRRTEEELLASRERFSSIVEGAAEGIYLIASDETITYANPAFCALTGYEEKELVGQKASVLGDFLEDARYESMWRHVRKGKTWSGFVTSRRKDGTVYERDITMSPVKDGGDTIAEYITISRDISREKRLEEQLRQSQKLEAIGTLAGGIAHDFNNILAAIIGFTELSMEDVPSDSPTQGHLSQIYKSAVRARDLVRQILTFSKQDGGEARFSPFAPLVRDALKLLRASIPANIELRQDVADTDEGLIADPKELQQVIIHLVTNAAQAMHSTGGTIDVGLSVFTPEDADPNLPAIMNNRAGFKLTIHDTGPGIDADATRRLFDPFFTTKGPGGGKGMGLPLVYGIVTRLGGMIQVASTIGEGATFTVYLPHARPEMPPGTREAPEGRHEPHRKKILFVDDEEALAEVTRHALERLGFEAVVLTDPEKALALFQESPKGYDLVLLDQAMPKMTGTALAQKIISIRPDTPVILQTGFSETISPETARSLGIRDLLMKPLVRGELEKAIRKVLG